MNKINMATINDWRLFSYRNMLNVLSILISLILMGCTFYSLHFGIPWHDEASHILPSYKFLLGQRPFIDEYGPIQLSAILTYPAFKLFYLLNHHSIDGIFIFERRLYTVISILSFFYLSRLLSFYLPLYLAILLGINLVSFAPFGLHSPFYDTLTQLFLTLGYFSLFRAAYLSSVGSKNPKWMFFVSGIWLGLTATIYPPLGICWVFAGLAYPYFTRERLKFYLMGLSLGVAWLIAVIGYIGIKQFFLSMHLVQVTDHPSSKLTALQMGITWYYHIFRQINIFFLALIIIRLFKNKFQDTLVWKISLLIILASLIIWIIFTQDSSFTAHGNSMGYTIAFFLCAPFLYLYLHSNKLAQSLFVYVWIPSLLTCPIVASISGSMGTSTVIVAFSGALVSLIFVCILFKSFVSPPWFEKISLSCLLLLVACAYQTANLKHFYGEVSPHPNQYCFRQGALKSICSSSQTAQLITQLEEKLQPFSGQNKTLSIFSIIGVGYFVKDFIPLIDTAYPSNLDNTLSFLNSKHQYPDIILIIKDFRPYWTRGDLPPLPPDVLKLLSEKYRLNTEEPSFVIYLKACKTRALKPGSKQEVIFGEANC